MTRGYERLKPVELPSLCKVVGMYPDGRGLYLRVTSPGAASWILRYMLAGKARKMGLGPYPDVSLRRAREKAVEARALKAERIDPVDKRRAERAAAKAAVAPPAPAVTFKVTAERVIESKQGGWKDKGKTAGQWDASLRDWVYPIIGEKPVTEIDTEAVLEVLTQPVKTKAGVQRFWEARPETASRCRSRIENILDFAKAKKERTGDNPAAWATVKFTLPKRHDVRAVEHHNAMPYDAVPGYIAKLHGRPGLSASALEFTILTVARTTEVRLMTWDEVDLKTKVWTVPKERMKGKKVHRVPLTDQVVAILRGREPGDAGSYVFPGVKPGRAMSENTMLFFLQETEGDEVTVHGFRSSFSDWVREQTDFPKELAEAALAHTVGSGVERAYARTDFFDKRRGLMEAWARHCLSERDPSARRRRLKLV